MNRQTAFAIAFACLAGCADAPNIGTSSPLTPSVTRSFVVYEKSPEQVAWYQHQFDVLSARFGFSLPAGSHIVLAGFGGVLPDGTVLGDECERSYCRLGNDFGLVCRSWPDDPDCAVRLGTLYADLMGVAPHLIRVGVGEVLAGGTAVPNPEDFEADRNLDMLSLLDDSLFDHVNKTAALRASAGALTRYLIDQAGVAKFVDICRSKNFDAEWAEVVGVSLSASITTWRDSPSYSGRRFAWNEPECTAAAIASTGTNQWSASLLLDQPTAIYATGSVARFDAGSRHFR